MVQPVIPADKLPVIVVDPQGRVKVARYRQTSFSIFALEPAASWEDLEADARQVAEQTIGAPLPSDVFPCPDDLAVRAAWVLD